MKPPPRPALADGVVTLRAHRPEDVDDVLRQCLDPQMQRWTQVPVPYERHHAEEFVAGRDAAWQAGTELSFAVEEAGRFAGTVDVRPRGDGTADVDYALAPWARGRGVMTRSLRTVLPWAFERLGLGTVHWTAHVGNWAGRRVAWALGFTVEGTVRAFAPHRDGPRDAWVGSLARGDERAPRHPWREATWMAGDGVVLRPLRDGDAPRIVEACADPRTAHWLSNLPVPYRESDARDHLRTSREDMAGGESVRWVVADPDDDRLLAHISLFGLRRDGGTGEIGYWAHPAARGRGMVTEAARLVSDHALRPLADGGLGLRRVLIRAAEGNRASRWVARSAGFAESGRDRAGYRLRDGTVDDDVRYERVAAHLAGGGGR